MEQIQGWYFLPPCKTGHNGIWKTDEPRSGFSKAVTPNFSTCPVSKLNSLKIRSVPEV